MFAIRLRVRPWRARCSPRSVGRATVTAPFSCATFISGEKVCRSSPFGPLTAMSPPAASDLARYGIGDGDGFSSDSAHLRSSDSPDVGDYLAPDALGAGFMAGHHAGGGADDRGAAAALNTGDAFVVDVAATA